ncbi:3751_t:CDS:2 [Funneliformis geosporum]|nr:3751_t:CDS:2 [Funneliformis geosporum]
MPSIIEPTKVLFNKGSCKVKRLITIVDKIWDYKAFKAIENNARKNTDEEFKSILDLMVYSCTRTTKQDGNRCSLADRYLTDALKKVHNAFIAPPKGEMIIRGGTINRAQPEKTNNRK